MSLELYAITLQPPTTIVASIVGQFSGRRSQEIVLARGSWLELLRPDPNTGQLTKLLSYNCFGILRSLAPFRIAGSSRDHIIVGSDSGRIAILEYDGDKNEFRQVHLETFGKTGVRRIVPGQYLAVDPKGRATMIASIERNKLVYVLNRDADTNITISSPLEAHTTRTLVYSLIAVDVGYENPAFAALETDYDDQDVTTANSYMRKYGRSVNGSLNGDEDLGDGDNDINDDVNGSTIRRKKLTYYELDLGLNHVIRKWTGRVDLTANVLVQVPGGTDGPSGVLIASDNAITYRHLDNPGHSVPIPRRYPIRRQQNKDIKTEQENDHGSVKRESEGEDENENAADDTHNETVKSFLDDDINNPVYIVSAVMHKMKGAFFFLLQSNYGDLYKVWLDHDGQTVQDLYIKYFDTIPLCVSLNILKSGFLFAACEGGDHRFYQFNKLGDDDNDTEFSSSGDYKLSEVVFTPKQLDNLQQVDSLPSLSPLLQTKVVNLTGDDAPQIYTVGGIGTQSSLRKLEHGLPVNEIVATELPAAPIGLWTTKITMIDEYDKYIVLSFSNETLVLSIGDNVEEVTDSAFLSSVSTIAVQQLGRDSLLQIHSRGIRHITANKEINEWEPPVGTSITAASTNNYQVAIALHPSNELVYFEIDDEGQLNEYEDHKELSEAALCLSLGDIPEGRVRSSFLAIGFDDSTIRILSLDLGNTLETLSVQALSAKPNSIRIINMANVSGSGLYLNVGLENGVYINSLLDSVTGELSDTRTRFLGPRAIEIFKGKTIDGDINSNEDIVLALSTKPWVGYATGPGLTFDMVPLSYESLSYASGFCSKDCPRGIVAVGGNVLRIFTIERLGEKINQQQIPLKYTPRRMVQNSFTKNFYVIETENNRVPDSDDNANEVDADNDTDSDNIRMNHQFREVRVEHRWASSIAVVDPLSKTVLSRVQLQDNEAAFSILNCNFDSHEAEYLVVGTARDQIMMPTQSHSGAFIHIYEYSEDGNSITLLHKTPVEQVPLALLEFQGRLLAGVGGILRIYDLGLKQLLRKSEQDLHLNNIMTLNTQGNRIVVGDIRNSLTFVVYKEKNNLLIAFADDAVARHITTAVMLDYDTVAAGDRFGNIFVLRCPKKASLASDEDSHGIYLRSQQPFLNGQANKLELLSHFYAQDIPTSLLRASLVVGGSESLVYSGIQGTIGALIPMISKQDADFFHQLEELMRQYDVPLAGRDHMMYRSYYAPVKSTIDGDLCERFGLLSTDKQELIANQLDRNAREIQRRVADVRIRAAF